MTEGRAGDGGLLPLDGEGSPSGLPAIPEAAMGTSRDPVTVYLASLPAENSRRTMRTALERAARVLTHGRSEVPEIPWHRLTFAHLSALRSALTVKYAPRTTNVTLAAVKGVLLASRRLRLLTAQEYTDAVDGMAAESGGEDLAGRMLTQDELRRLFAVARATRNRAQGARDMALLSVLAGGGLRRFEVAALAVDDYDPETGALRIARGKGRKPRVVYILGHGQSALVRWVELRGKAPGALFPTLRDLERASDAPLPAMSDKGVSRAVLRLAARARLTVATPHDFRRTYISRLLDNGADISTAQKLAGHASPATTQKYDRRGEERKIEASRAIVLPFDGAGYFAPLGGAIDVDTDD